MSSGGKNSAKEAKTSTPSDTNTPPGSPGKSVSGVTLSPARKQSFEKGVEMAEKRLYLDSQKPESDSEDNLRRHDSFHLIDANASSMDIQEVIVKVRAARPDIKRENRLESLSTDILAKYRNHPRVLHGILEDSDKLAKLTREFAPHRTTNVTAKKRWDHFRHTIRGALGSREFGELWDITILVFSFITVVVYVAETYTDGVDEADRLVFSQTLVWIDFVCTMLFLTDFVLQTVASVPIIGVKCGIPYPIYWFSGGLIDLLTVVPYFLTMAVFGPNAPNLTNSDSVSYVFSPQFLNANGTISLPIVLILLLRMLRVMKTLRFTREIRLENCLRSKCKLSTMSSKITAILVSMFLGYFCFCASLIYLLEVEVEQLQVAIHNQECQNPNYTSYPWASCPAECVSSSGCQTLSWFQSMWMIIVTFTTVGYGDFSPVTLLGQGVAMGIIMFGVGFVGLKIGVIQNILATSNSFKSKYVMKGEIGHIIVSGTITKDNLNSLLHEHFHPDHKTPDKFEVEDVVIMNPSPPPSFVLHMLVHGDHALKLQYYEGDVMSMKDLENVSISTAKHVHLLVNPDAASHERDDARIIVRATALKSHNPDVTIHAQCHMVVTKRHMEKLLTRGTEQHCPDAVVCLDLLKARMFAQNCLVPGSSTLIANLFASFSAPESEENASEEDTWLASYFHGCGQELYSKQAPSCFHNRSFQEAADAIFRGHFIRNNESEEDQDEAGGVVLVGVVEHPNNFGMGDNRRRVLINPGKHYIIKEDCKLLLIADDEEVATAIEFATQTPRTSSGNKYLAGQMRVNLDPDNHPSHNNLLDKIRAREEQARRASLNARALKAKVADSAITADLSQTRNADDKLGNTEGISQEEHIQLLVEHTKKIDKKLDAMGKNRKARHKMRLHWMHLDVFDEVDTSHHLKFKNHIVICGDNPRLGVFVAAVRECLPKHLGKDGVVANVPIVVISQTDPLHGGREAWGFGVEEIQVGMLGDIYHAHGNPGKVADLQECCVSTASCVIIMPSGSDGNEKDELDAELLTTFLAVESCLVDVARAEKPRIIVESAYPMAMHLLNTYHQTHFNTEKKFGDEEISAVNIRDAMAYIDVPLYASGTIMSARSLDAILCQTTYTPEVLDFLNCCLSMSSSDHLSVMEDSDEEHSSGILVQCDIEEKYYNKAYLRVFEGMLADYGMIAIAVYRVNEVSGLPFVYTCPHPMDTVLETDKVFAIASFPCSTKCSNFLEKTSSGSHFNPTH